MPENPIGFIRFWWDNLNPRAKLLATSALVLASSLAVIYAVPMSRMLIKQAFTIAFRVIFGLVLGLILFELLFLFPYHMGQIIRKIFKGTDPDPEKRNGWDIMRIAIALVAAMAAAGILYAIFCIKVILAVCPGVWTEFVPNRQVPNSLETFPPVWYIYHAISYLLGYWGMFGKFWKSF